ncbi:small acid-soluble spore protein K [Shouchella lonarensis]|uniref:Small acid-soluble spore protein K (Minor) n=1 Tax=Shouchella lonarensis TaxID=1464122 RepID=A0A1G6GPM6_9BACI|nr:small acid-soluble spore protein K [Shouchella lonarensis]SDB83894.1 small acid-soluble spore protein K (minor) [Shouchella lonarensis]
MRNKAKGFPNHISFSGLKAEQIHRHLTKRADSSINAHHKERAHPSNHFKTP